jgi:hypothetical protein
MGVWRKGTVRAVWRGSESFEKGLRRARSSARSMPGLPAKCQRISCLRKFPIAIAGRVAPWMDLERGAAYLIASAVIAVESAAAEYEGNSPLS